LEKRRKPRNRQTNTALSAWERAWTQPTKQTENNSKRLKNYSQTAPRNVPSPRGNSPKQSTYRCRRPKWRCHGFVLAARILSLGLLLGGYSVCQLFRVLHFDVQTCWRPTEHGKLSIHVIRYPSRPNDTQSPGHKNRNFSQKLASNV
jgi:hypothetical protein